MRRVVDQQIFNLIKKKKKIFGSNWLKLNIIPIAFRFSKYLEIEVNIPSLCCYDLGFIRSTLHKQMNNKIFNKVIYLQIFILLTN